ncbi:hypothetical protein [Sphingobacterium sp. DR205]|uniref:hypothetical protein n=1 Tax=Sphingobacterium sp. DR205 TaxID=2713573 RepID=UPI0013E4BF85|nr:hypothetical protein [Sphingobacterium sp. DR205]QIH36753.1 hypothetical protein G6053_29590 [Sphingobacterium sp. DR205]
MDIFNAEQKEKSGGYDAVITSWSKLLVPVDKIVDRLRREIKVTETNADSLQKKSGDLIFGNLANYKPLYFTN